MRRNLKFVDGTTFSFSGVLRDGDGNPVDLTSASMTWRIIDKDQLYGSSQLTDGNGIVKGAETGSWTVTIPSSLGPTRSFRQYIHQGLATIGSAVYLFTSGNVLLQSRIKHNGQ